MGEFGWFVNIARNATKKPQLTGFRVPRLSHGDVASYLEVLNRVSSVAVGLVVRGDINAAKPFSFFWHNRCALSQLECKDSVSEGGMNNIGL